MRNLTPPFILEKTKLGLVGGALDAVVLFVDTSGFTRLTAHLTEQGRDGAEILADILLAVFEPLVETVYAHGGFIAGFAGDAFKAIFRGLMPESYRQALAVAEQILSHMASHPTYETRYGTFDFSVRISMADGPVNWAVWSGEDSDVEQSCGYTFFGPAIDQAIQGEGYAAGGEWVMTEAVYAASLAAQPDAIAAEALAGAAEGYLRINQITDTLPGPQPLTQTEPVSFAEASRFYPTTLLTRQIQGEFRPVYTLFINIKSLPISRLCVHILRP